MISQEQAHATADRWLNPEQGSGHRREIGMHEFSLGWVVWAVPPPPERDPATGQRRPPAEVGNASGVVDRRTGELSVWPSVPAVEVARMYEQQHAAAAPPVTGPGNTAVVTYRDPANGEETNLFRVSSPGQPPAEYQVWQELQRTGVPADAVSAVHTDLRPSLLPGGYTADFLLRTFPDARFSCSQGYGTRPEERAEGIAALRRQVEQIHRTAGQQPPPAPHRAPVPSAVVPAPEPSVEEVGALLERTFGAERVRRYPADALAEHPLLPESARTALVVAGLPAEMPYFFSADDPADAPAGGLFADAATHFRARDTEVPEQMRETLADHVRIGSDGLYAVTVQCRGPEHARGAVWAAHPESGGGRYVNGSLTAFARALALLEETRSRLRGLDPVAAGTVLATFQEQLATIDPSALDNEQNWWSLVVEQMWHGLF